MTRRWARRVSVACVTAGLLSVGVGSAGIIAAHADADPGSGLGAMDMTARASGVRMVFYNTGDGGEDVEGIAPYSTAEMSSGNLGHALTSVFWPGDTGGNGGTTLKLLGPICIPPDPQGLVPGLPCPAQVPPLPDSAYESLNDPERAEAQTGTGQPTATLSRPWGTMTATATAAKVVAETTLLGGKELPTGDTFGTTQVTSTINLDGARNAVVDAVSTVRGIDLGGVIHIDAVVSKAHGTTDGEHADGTAHTTVVGATIGGVPVTIDETGVHVQGQGSSLDQLDQVNQALVQAGFSIYVSKPTKNVTGSGATLDGGSLVIRQDRPEYTSEANSTGKLIVLGGASVIADANLGYDGGSLTLPAVDTPMPAGAAPAGGPVAAGTTAPSLPDVGTPPSIARNQPQSFAPVVAGQRLALPHGLPAGYLVLVLLGGLLAAAGLRQLPDRLFAAAAAPCPLGDTS